MRLIDLKVQTFKVKTSGEKNYLERNGSTMKRFFHQYSSLTLSRFSNTLYFIWMKYGNGYQESPFMD